MTRQTCRVCNKEKSIDEFWLSRHKRPETLCKSCKQEAQTERRRQNRDEVNAKQRERYANGVRYTTVYDPEQRRKWMLKSKYGLTVEQFEAMWGKQDGKCPACGDQLILGTKNGAHVDHCHSTGSVRGILCGLCNVALGFLKDDPDRIMGLHGYILEVNGD